MSAAEKRKKQALKMRESGMTYQAIADELGVHRLTVRTYCDEDYRETRRKLRKKGYQRWRKSEIGRFCLAITSSKYRAKRRCHKPCSANADEIEKAFTGCCHICGVKETTENSSCLEHCHSTGKFRGWVCKECNLVLGCVNDDIPLLRCFISYLKGKQ